MLDAIRVHVDRGSALAVLGRTGSGKSTLASLLLRLYNAKSDMIRIDGRPIYEIPLSVLRREVFENLLLRVRVHRREGVVQDEDGRVLQKGPGDGGAPGGGPPPPGRRWRSGLWAY